MIEINSENFEAEIIRCNAQVLVEFSAPWCSVCRKLERLMDSIQHQLTDVKFCCVDVDKNSELAKKYSVTAIPTFLAFEDGVVKSRGAGGLTKKEIYVMLGRKPAGTTV